VPSPAYDQWTEHVSDAAALQRLREVGGTRVRNAWIPLTPLETDVLGRAAVVALSAAFERYVVELFRVAAVEVGVSIFRVEEHLLHFAGEQRRFANPNAANVGDLFGLVFPGDSVWVGVCTPSRSEESAQRFVDDHQEDRHGVAHGRLRCSFSVPEMRGRAAEFEQIVQALDESAGVLVRSRRKDHRCSWLPE